MNFGAQLFLKRIHDKATEIDCENSFECTFVFANNELIKNNVNLKWKLLSLSRFLWAYESRALFVDCSSISYLLTSGHEGHIKLAL